MVSAQELAVPKATAADLASECPACAAVIEPERIVHDGGPIAIAHYTCRCGRQRTAVWCWLEDRA